MNIQKRLATSLGIVVILTAMIPCLVTPARPAEAGEHPHEETGRISVSGTGEVERRPDMAEIRIGVVTEAETASEAVKENNEKMRKLFSQLKEHEIAEKDIQTSNFQVSPQHDRPRPQEERSPRIIGYRVSNQVHVRVRKLDSLGKVLDDVVQAGANQINNIRFSVSEPQKWNDQARRMAVEDAQRKARLMAKAAGVKLGKVLRIDEGGQPTPRPMELRTARAASESVPIAAGRETLRAQVNVTYALDQESDHGE